MSAVTALPAALLAANGEGYQAPGTGSFNFKSFTDFTLFGLAFHINRITTMLLFGVIVIIVFFWAAFAKPKLVPGRAQALGEMTYDFIRDGVARDVIGPEGLRFAPFLLTLFAFILVMNFYEILPLAQVPVTSRIAFPALLAVISFVLFNYVGIRKQGLVKYFKNNLIVPGVPKAMILPLAVIEFFSTFVARPFTLAIRLFANMFAGHLLLLIFISSTYYLATVGNYSVIFSPVAFLMSILLTFFELIVITLQAYVFTVLTAVYVAGALEEEH